MVSCPITSWQTEGGKLEVVTDFLFLGSKTTADSNWSHEIKRHSLLGSWASLMAQLVKNRLAMQETWVQCLGWEDPLEKGKATHSSILAWRIPWIAEPGGLQSMELQRIRHDWATCHAVLQGIFPTQALNPGLPHCRWILYQLRYQWKKPDTKATHWWFNLHECPDQQISRERK